MRNLRARIKAWGRGEGGLAFTFWVLVVAGNGLLLGLNALFTWGPGLYLVHSDESVAIYLPWLGVNLGYGVYSLAALGRAALRYEGPKIWSAAAMFAVIFSALWIFYRLSALLPDILAVIPE